MTRILASTAARRRRPRSPSWRSGRRCRGSGLVNPAFLPPPSRRSRAALPARDRARASGSTAVAVEPEPLRRRARWSAPGSASALGIAERHVAGLREPPPPGSCGCCGRSPASPGCRSRSSGSASSPRRPCSSSPSACSGSCSSPRRARSAASTATSSRWRRPSASARPPRGSIKILLPAATPGILVGLRTALGQAWMAVVAAEIFGVPGVGAAHDAGLEPARDRHRASSTCSPWPGSTG